MIEAAERELGRSTSWSTMPASSTWRRSKSFPTSRWDAIIAINLSAAFHAIKAALPGMKRRGWGRIINIASAHGLVASGEKAAYVAAKHGLVGFTKVTAIETANNGITCNAICPGWVLTPLVQKQVEAKAKEAGIRIDEAKENLVREKQPMLRSPRPSRSPRWRCSCAAMPPRP